jgi:hypothetical protein
MVNLNKYFTALCPISIISVGDELDEPPHDVPRHRLARILLKTLARVYD